ncbi:MAG TPA: hypothetical protein VLF62_05970 [Candidatus Saccharimonadales bacterium]|nr:hypothetical protein [Candidatus Saccharimonadales bacterium]
MPQRVFYRNIRARDQLELFLVSAASSLLLLRFYLYLTGYPQIGSGGLHIAHMLWGGLLMMGAVVTSLAFQGIRVQRVVALLGGIGFGVFIDELGKFITRDNNYFYHPTIGIIYGVFIALYLTFNFLSREKSFTSREYQLNALSQLEEAVLNNMDPVEKRRVELLLAHADPKDPTTKQLQQLVQRMSTIRQPQPSRLTTWWRNVRQAYQHRWRRRNSNWLVRVFFIGEVLLFVVGGFVSLSTNIGSNAIHIINSLHTASVPVWGQLLSSLVAVGFVAWGVALWPKSRLRAYEQFRRATLVNLFLTQFFAFARLEFLALPGFIFNIALLGFISFAMQLQRDRGKDL